MSDYWYAMNSKKVKPESEPGDWIKDKETRGGCLGWVVAFVALLGFVPLRAWLLATFYWPWFIAPLGLPQINIWWALGLSSALSFIRARRTGGAWTKPEDKKETGADKQVRLLTECAVEFALHFVSLGIGYLIHQQAVLAGMP